MMPVDETQTSLGLNFLPIPSSISSIKAKPNNNYHVLKDHQAAEPLLTLSLKLSVETTAAAPPEQAGSAATSSLSNNIVDLVAVKRERQETPGSDEEVEVDGGGFGPTSVTRKKLRLNKEQSAFLEDSFNQHTTLNPKQKQALADRLNLLPRQIEVWFQNRRARTKLKKTEMDCEQMKKYCDNLTEENRRLQKELQELKALKLGQPSLYMQQAPAATLAMCPSCVQTHGSDNPLSFTLGPDPGSKPHFYPCFPNPSAAC